MPMSRRNSQVFHRTLYAGQLEKITLLKRGDDQNEGQVVAYILFQCRRGNLAKQGEALQGEMAVSHSTQWVIPNTELRRVGVNYIDVLDRIVDQFNMWWQPESANSIVLSQFDNFTIIETVRVDPPLSKGGGVRLGNLAIGLPLP